MPDRLLAFANHPWSAPLVRTLGLPAPPPLRRAQGAYVPNELAGRRVLLRASRKAFAEDACRAALAEFGAVAGADAPWQVAVVDATGCTTAADLQFLREALQPAVTQLERGARVLLLADREPDGAEAAACARAVEGFTRSVAKELGRRGATANCVYLAPRDLPGLPAAIAFFCSDRSAYVSGQALRLAPGTLDVASPALPAFAGKTALVTGAAGGIGAATARRLARDGAFVLCTDVAASQDALTALAAEVQGASLALDLTAPDAPLQVLDALSAGVDIVVHNAGITRDRTLARMSEAEWNEVLGVNLQAVLALDAALAAGGALRDGGRQIYLSSISGIAGNAGQTNYSLTKAALLGYVQARARALAGRRITANAVAPGFIETAMTRRIPFMVREVGRRLNSLMQGGCPEDVAEAIAFLARADAQGFTGQVLRVCGQSYLGA